MREAKKICQLRVEPAREGCVFLVFIVTAVTEIHYL